MQRAVTAYLRARKVCPFIKSFIANVLFLMTHCQRHPSSLRHALSSGCIIAQLAGESMWVYAPFYTTGSWMSVGKLPCIIRYPKARSRLIIPHFKVSVLLIKPSWSISTLCGKSLLEKNLHRDLPKYLNLTFSYFPWPLISPSLSISYLCSAWLLYGKPRWSYAHVIDQLVSSWAKLLFMESDAGALILWWQGAPHRPL